MHTATFSDKKSFSERVKRVRDTERIYLPMLVPDRSAYPIPVNHNQALMAGCALIDEGYELRIMSMPEGIFIEALGA